jgi:anti-sigma B factor antagonist
MIRAHFDSPTTLTLDVHGPATMLEGATVEANASAHIARGARVVRVDLRDCTVMDSTFTGTLLALKRRLDALDGELVLVSPSAPVLKSLELMGLDDFYEVDVEARVDGPWQPVTTISPERRDLERLVLDAHELLSDVPGPAAREFRSVVDELRRGQDAAEATPLSAEPPSGRRNARCFASQ